jgi:hypothetical protein
VINTLMNSWHGQAAGAGGVKGGQQTYVKIEETGERLELNQIEFPACGKEWWGTA